ncbi:hypothetical protein B0G69_6901 [Paraburkholderia sp. RAU2J]|nr:hypothetical protein B0G69_6901 [Paraburkholderia sp. RAU2J]
MPSCESAPRCCPAVDRCARSPTWRVPQVIADVVRRHRPGFGHLAIARAFGDEAQDRALIFRWNFMFLFAAPQTPAESGRSWLALDGDADRRAQDVGQFWRRLNRPTLAFTLFGECVVVPPNRKLRTLVARRRGVVDSGCSQNDMLIDWTQRVNPAVFTALLIGSFAPRCASAALVPVIVATIAP